MTDQAPPRTWRLSRRQRPAPLAGACPNCGTPVSDRFCPHCGQRNATRLVSLGRMLADAADDQLSLGGALPRTLGALFLRPGHLTREYVAGRIARYVPPFRLYLVASLLFFVALAGLADADSLWSEVERNSAEVAAELEAQAAAGAAGDDTGPAPYRNVGIVIDTAAMSPLVKPLARRLARQVDRMNRLPPREALRVMLEGTLRTAPKVVFAMLPVVAAILWLLYARRRRFYVEHFVFALHLHAFAFLLATVAIVFRSGTLGWIVLAWTLVYLLVAMKKNYGQGWPMTAAKYLALLFLYQVAVVLGLAATFLATLLMV